MRKAFAQQRVDDFPALPQRWEPGAATQGAGDSAAAAPDLDGSVASPREAEIEMCTKTVKKHFQTRLHFARVFLLLWCVRVAQAMMKSESQADRAGVQAQVIHRIAGSCGLVFSLRRQQD